jgi:predicted transcriptional regulator
VQYCAEHRGDKPAIADSLAKSPQCTTEALIRLAPHFTQAGVQAVLDDLSRLTTVELAKALAACPGATPEQKELLQETEKGEVEAEVLAQALEEAEPDVQKRTTLLQRITKMNVVQRVQLALKGGREERNALIRDPNKMVQRAVLQSPRLVDRDVEAFAAMTTLSTDALRLIAARRSFMKNYTIVKALINNPKTPVSVSMHLLPRLTSTDLKMLTTNKNIPEVLRNTALKMYRQRNTRPA